MAMSLSETERDRRATPLMPRNHLRRYQMPTSDDTMRWHLRWLEAEGCAKPIMERSDPNGPVRGGRPAVLRALWDRPDR